MTTTKAASGTTSPQTQTSSWTTPGRLRLAWRPRKNGAPRPRPSVAAWHTTSEPGLAAVHRPRCTASTPSSGLDRRTPCTALGVVSSGSGPTCRVTTHRFPHIACLLLRLAFGLLGKTLACPARPAGVQIGLRERLGRHPLHPPSD